jgi:hypothetical protein
MSLINLVLGDDRALMIANCDSLDLASGRTFETCKIHLLPHVCAAVSLRGHVFFSGVVAMFLSASLFETFEDVEFSLEKVLTDAFTFMRSQPQYAGRLCEIEQQEAVLAGWSSQRGCMVGRHMRQVQAKHGFVDVPVCAGGQLIPWDDDKFGAPDQIAGVDDLVALTRRQVRLCEEHFNGAPFGGRLLVADIRSDRLTMTIHPSTAARLETCSNFMIGAL